jgi:hypothetical protein
MDLTESPRRGAGDSISSSKISKAIIATSSSPDERHCLATFKMLGMNWRNLTCTYTWLESTLENSEGQK